MTRGGGGGFSNSVRLPRLTKPLITLRVEGGVFSFVPGTLDGHAPPDFRRTGRTLTEYSFPPIQTTIDVGGNQTRSCENVVGITLVRTSNGWIVIAIVAAALLDDRFSCFNHYYIQ